VICVDELPCLPKGAACGVLVDARAFLVALATFLESLNLLNLPNAARNAISSGPRRRFDNNKKYICTKLIW